MKVEGVARCQKFEAFEMDVKIKEEIWDSGLDSHIISRTSFKASIIINIISLFVSALSLICELTHDDECRYLVFFHRISLPKSCNAIPHAPDERLANVTSVVSNRKHFFSFLYAMFYSREEPDHDSFFSVSCNHVPYHQRRIGYIRMDNC